MCVVHTAPSDHDEAAPCLRAGVHVAAVSVKKRLNYVNALSCLTGNSPGGLLIATSKRSSAHQTFLIKFQVNWLRSDVPEAEWQSRSKDNTELLVREPEQQEKGNSILLLFLLWWLSWLCGLLKHSVRGQIQAAQLMPGSLLSVCLSICHNVFKRCNELQLIS